MIGKATLLAPAAIFASGVLLVNGIREQHVMKSRAPMSSVTADLHGLRGKDIIVGEQERRVAGMSDYSLRSFGADSAPLFTTYVGYYERQVQGQTIHSPKNCLPGAGWEIVQTERVPLPGGAAGETINRVMLANRGVRALVYYWYQGRGRKEASEYRVKWNLLHDAALYGRTEEALVRIVVPIGRVASAQASMTADAAAIKARALADELVPTLSAEVDRVLPRPPGAS